VRHHSIVGRQGCQAIRLGDGTKMRKPLSIELSLRPILWWYVEVRPECGRWYLVLVLAPPSPFPTAEKEWEVLELV
jgi:hypothetical protein